MIENEDDEQEEEEEPDSLGEQQPISLPGYTAPPIHYDGPEFPIRAVPSVREPEPETTADELAAKIKRADKLQTEIVDWLVTAWCLQYDFNQLFACHNTIIIIIIMVLVKALTNI